MPVFQRLFEKCAADNNGKITWPFNQGIIDDESGTCASLCAHWIKYHSNDHHLSIELIKKKKGIFEKNFLNKSEARRIVAVNEHRQGRRKDLASVISQMLDIQSWLKIFGLRPLVHPVTHNYLFSFKNCMDDAVADDCCTQSHLMVNALLKYTSCYVLIVVHNTDVAIAGTHYSGTGHALCAWLGNRQSGSVHNNCG